MAISVGGLGSGLDVQGMVSQLVAAERAPSDQRLTRDISAVSAELSAFSQLKSVVSSFQSSLSSLTGLDSFDNRKATTSDNALVGVSVSGIPDPGSYSIGVSSLASEHTLAASAVADKHETALGTGTITIRLGTTDYDEGSDTYNGFTLNEDTTAASIEIDSGNNTLEGIMRAINDADAGVHASIVNDGSGYRLLLSAAETGAAHSIEIGIDDGDGADTDASGLSFLAFNSSATNLQQTGAASDAQLTLNGLAVTSATNKVDSVIEGLTLNLKEVTESNVKVNVEKDSGAVKTAVNSFINGYNKFIATVNQLTDYDAETGRAGQLLGDFTVRSIRSQIDGILRNPVPGAQGNYQTLFDAGISTGENGELKVDSDKLEEILDSDPDAIKRLFTAMGAPTDADIAYKASSSATQVGNYDVSIDTLATAGSLSGASVLPDFGAGGSVTIDDDNDNFSIAIDGAEAVEITLSQGSYASGGSLAAEIQARINGMDAFRQEGLAVSVSYDADNGALVIASNSVGSESSVEITEVDGNSAATLGLSVGEGTPGADVAGSINGEAGTGTGNALSAADGNAAQGLILEVGGSATGSRGSVAFSRGIASRLDSLLEGFLEKDGSLDSRISTLEDRSEAINDRRENLEAKWDKVEERYLRQFNQLDSLLAQLESTSSFLQTQLAQLPQIKLNSKR